MKSVHNPCTTRAPTKRGLGQQASIKAACGDHHSANEPHHIFGDMPNASLDSSMLDGGPNARSLFCRLRSRFFGRLGLGVLLRSLCRLIFC